MFKENPIPKLAILQGLDEKYMADFKKWYKIPDHIEIDRSGDNYADLIKKTYPETRE